MKHVRFKPETTYQVLGGELNLAIQQALPSALQAAGINPAMLKEYLPAVMAQLVPMTAHLLTQRLYNQGMAVWGAESSPLVQQIKVNISNAMSASGTSNANGGAPVAQPAALQNIFVKPPSNVTPIRPAQPVQQPAPLQQFAPVVSGDNPPEISM